MKVEEDNMGIPVLIIGESGSGKSASMRNFKPGEVGIINVSSKPLPFKSEIKSFNSDDYAKIESVIKKATTKSIVIDDAQYLMANEFMRSAKQTGFQKFTDIALNFWSLVQLVIKELPDDVIVYFTGHVDRNVDGSLKFKTIGKLLDEKITIEGLFTIVLRTSVTDGKYTFSTQTDGMDTVKSPIGMFGDLQIDNDLRMVDSTIRQYYNIGGNKNEKD